MRTSKAINDALKRRGITNVGIMHIKSRKGRVCMMEWKEDGEILPLAEKTCSRSHAKDAPLTSPQVVNLSRGAQERKT